MVLCEFETSQGYTARCCLEEKNDEEQSKKIPNVDFCPRWG